MVESTVLFTFIVPQRLKDDVTDHLMNSELASGFNLLPIMGYSQKHAEYSLEEQVRGYKKMLQFEVLIELQHIDTFKSDLSKVFNSVKVRYWQTPVSNTGHL
jgi:hypothetical protein